MYTVAQLYIYLQSLVVAIAWVSTEINGAEYTTGELENDCYRVDISQCLDAVVKGGPHRHHSNGLLSHYPTDHVDIVNGTVVVHSIWDLEKRNRWQRWIATTSLDLVDLADLSFFNLPEDGWHPRVESSVEGTEERFLLPLCFLVAGCDRGNVSRYWLLTEHCSSSLERFEDIVLVCVSRRGY